MVISLYEYSPVFEAFIKTRYKAFMPFTLNSMFDLHDSHDGYYLGYGLTFLVFITILIIRRLTFIGSDDELYDEDDEDEDTSRVSGFHSLAQMDTKLFESGRTNIKTLN